MTQALAGLSNVVGETIGRHNGVRPLEQGEGDSFVAAFARPSEAVACALEIATSSKLPLRIAVHTGEAHRTDDGTYVGPALNRAGRLRDAAHGGQVVLSNATVEIVTDRLPPDASLRDLGSHRLRDLSRPERVFQLEHPELQRDFPPLHSLDTYRHNLPQYRTAFFGRRQDMDDLAALMHESRLVTVTGAGGCGKTRLALHVAARLVDKHRNGVFFVELSTVGDGADVFDAVATALGVTENAATVLEPFLSDRTVLLVLDNCEHVVTACAELCDRLLAAAPGLHVLTTSREPLGVAGETTYVVPSLAVPPEGGVNGIAGLAPYAAGELFLDRARRTTAGFRPGDDDAAAIAEICRRLDGIPLAIELAAARVRVLSPRQIADGLDERFRLLTGGARTALARQQTLRASVDWSHDLLTEPERVVFRRLAVLSGDGDLAAASAVCSGAGVEPHQVLDLLSLLIDKSLVQVGTDGRDARYRMLETIRQYAAERLADARETEDTHRRHLDHFVSVAERLGAQAEGPAGLDAFDAFPRERDNLEAAFRWSRDHDDTDAAVRIACGVSLVVATDWINGASPWWTPVVPLLDRASPQVQSRALYVAALHWHDRFLPGAEGAAVLALAEASLDRHRSTGSDPRELGRALLAAALLRWQLYDPNTRCIATLREAIVLARSAGDTECIAFASIWLAYTEMANGADPRAPLDEALSAGRDSASPLLRQHVSWWRFSTLLGEGEFRLSLESTEQMLASVEGHRTLYRHNLANRAYELCWLGRFGEARALAEEVLPERMDVGDLGCASSLRWAIGCAREAAGDADGALAHFDAGIDADVSSGASPYAHVWSSVHVHLSRADAPRARQLMQSRIPPELMAEHGLIDGLISYAEGDAEEAEELVHAALGKPLGNTWGWADWTLELLGTVAVDRGREVEGIRMLAAAQADRDRTGYALRLAYMANIRTAALDRARKTLGDDAFGQAWDEGAAMSRDDALAYVRRGRGERGRPSSGWKSLTPTEEQVVALVAEGIGNPEIARRMFVSVRTVTTHLSHVYAKLGISSRAELVAEANRRS